MKKVLIATLLIIFYGLLTGCSMRNVNDPDDAYYSKITKISKKETMTIVGYNSVLDKKTFKIASKDLTEDMLKDGYIKIVVDGNDKVLEVHDIKKSDLNTLPKNKELLESLEKESAEEKIE